MKCIKIPNGWLQVNTYLIGDELCYVVDPGDEFGLIKNKINQNFKGVKAILLTHGHLDHIGSVDKLVAEYNCDVYMHTGDIMYVDGSLKNDRMMGNAIVTLTTPTIDALTINDNNIVVLETPGHSKGSVCYWFKEEKILFTGDTLFSVDIGRTDLPGGSTYEIMQSLKVLKTLPDDLIVHPGHEESSTLGHEKKNNLYLSRV